MDLLAVVSELLSTFASDAFKMACERAYSVRQAKVELDKLKSTMTTIKAMLIDAKKKQSDSETVRNWVKRVKDVLYAANDLSDKVAADDKSREQMKGNKLMMKMKVWCIPRLNPILSKNSIAIEVKSIRKDLENISADMRIFDFAICQDVPISMREGRDTGSFVDSKSVIGRDKDKKAILELLLRESKDDVVVIAIVGMGGMGKTTLTQLVYNDKKVAKNFEKRWFACISHLSDHKKVYGKIFRSMYETNINGLDLNTLENKIKESMKDKKFLLVLDDVWDDDRSRWGHRMSLLLSRGARGSKIIVTTRSMLVADVVGASRTHNLCDLLEDDSWNLFKREAGLTKTTDQKRKRRLGRIIVKQCPNVPLAIKTMGCLLFEKNSIEEWESISKQKLPPRVEDYVMSVLQLSYNYLRPNLKECFAYCSLFPKDYVFDKDELVHLWIAQGYINLVNKNQVEEKLGHGYFMDLLRRSFFQMDGRRYKMHDLMHDLAVFVAREETILLSAGKSMIRKRHVSVGDATDQSQVQLETLQHSPNPSSLLFLKCPESFSELDQWIKFTDWKCLRALKLSNLKMKKISTSIKVLKMLRYLDISRNDFKELPKSFTELVNLQTLNISYCKQLESLPRNFGKLVSLRQLYNNGCKMLKHYPTGFEKLTGLKHLSEFRVCKGTDRDGGEMFTLDGLSQLKLEGELLIKFEDYMDELSSLSKLTTLGKLQIYYYSGIWTPNWRKRNLNLTSLSLWDCTSAEYLPSFRDIPNLKNLLVCGLTKLEYIEEEALCIPGLERLELQKLPKLKRWSKKESSKFTLPASLTFIDIDGCPNLSFSWPKGETSSRGEEWSFPGRSLTSLRELHIDDSKKLKGVKLPPSRLNILEVLELKKCPELKLWEESNRGVNWDSLPKLRKLIIDERVPCSKMLPSCLRHRQKLGELKIDPWKETCGVGSKKKHFRG